LLLNDKGQLLERFQFTQLDTADVPSDATCSQARLQGVNLESDKASSVKAAQTGILTGCLRVSSWSAARAKIRKPKPSQQPDV
jgi:negative regulator of sigma E activity